ncbi:uncharacterized protein ACUW6V_001434 [Cronobacter sp. 153480017-3]|uniref:Stress-induced protein n=4 Tax=Cronobacter TaxID=413496 RepID=A7MNT3_CROS8|nr:hypothetical protein ESA_02178 [Cronobacter sakazakii ATCC BAA-894]AKE96409.1 hypothetical protein CSK29544_03462 [Cronobacter sakazakii]
MISFSVLTFSGNTKPIPEVVMAEHRGGSGNFAENREKASEAGKKGGQQSGGNFKNDPERASEAGKKGGQNSHSGGRK